MSYRTIHLGCLVFDKVEELKENMDMDKNDIELGYTSLLNKEENKHHGRKDSILRKISLPLTSPVVLKESKETVPIVSTICRLLLAVLSIPVLILAGTVVGVLLLPHNIIQSRRKLWFAIIKGPLGSSHSPFLRLCRLLFYTCTLLLFIIAGAVVGGIIGFVLGIAFPILRALFGPNAPDLPFDCIRHKPRRSHLQLFNEHLAIAMMSDKFDLHSKHISRKKEMHDSSSVFDEYAIHVRSLVPKGKVKAILIFHHGVHHHGSAKQNLELAMFFAERGFTVYLPDAFGHGHSDGAHAVIRSFDDLANDLAYITDICCKKHPLKPVFLMGESLGGLLVLLSYGHFSDLCRESVKGILASCPAFLIHSQTARSWADDIADLLPLDFLSNNFPKLPMVPATRGNCYPEDEILQEIAQNIEKEDHLHYKGYMKLATALCFRSTLLDPEGRTNILNHIKNISCPILLQHGSHDKCVDIEGSKQLVDILQSDQKDLIEYSGKCHALMNEDEETKQTYLQNSLAFCDEIMALNR